MKTLLFILLQKIEKRKQNTQKTVGLIVVALALLLGCNIAFAENMAKDTKLITKTFDGECMDFNEDDEVVVAFMQFHFKYNIEGFIENPKWDSKQWTWGYGTKVGYMIGFSTDIKGNDILCTKEVENKFNEFFSQSIKKREALQVLDIRVSEGVDTMVNLFGDRWYHLNLNQQVALLDIAFNEGYSAFARSKVATMVKNGNSNEVIAKEMVTGYSKQKGTQRRLKLRRDLFLGLIKL